MCGICGWLDFKNSLQQELSTIKAMTETLKLRGPNSDGYYLDKHLVFGHRRLVVIDPEGGQQPMVRSFNNSKYVLVYNGELYNTEELRKTLLDKGFSFEGYSDTEVLLYSYIYWGISCLDHLNGIFAFAIYDENKQSLLLVRDQLGVKPLFYSLKGSSIIFASEIKSLLANPSIKPVLDKDGLTELFALGPATALGSGILKGIKEIPPAHYAYMTKDNFILQEYWKVEAEEFKESLSEAEEHLGYLLKSAITGQLISDVPLCTFLSGGLDSSAISAIAAEEFKKHGKSLTTYSIDYEDNSKFFKSSAFQPSEDSYYINQMREYIGSNHKSIVLDNKALAQALYEATLARDMPGMADIDSSLLLFCREIKKDFVVALSGECADEIFGGYPWYRRKELINAPTFPWSRSINERKAILDKHLENLPLEECANYHYQKTLGEVPHIDGESKEEYRMREIFYLNVKWFMVNLLNRKDRMSMYNSLEVRVPFADKRLVQYAFNLPSEIRFVDNMEKGLLRRVLRNILPEEIIYRKKNPYPKTHHPEYTNIVSSMLSEIINNKKSPILSLINKEVAQEIIDSGGASYKTPWFGQLMTGAQLIAYLVQLNIWLKEYKVQLEI